MDKTAEIAAGWQPIQTMPPDFDGAALLWGRLYGWDDTEAAVAEEEPRLTLFAYQFERNGRQMIASNETYYGSETYYVAATLWVPLDDLVAAAILQEQSNAD